MRLFLSYGHVGNRPLVDRLRRDLVAHGHEIWIDSEQIRLSDDWRRKILDGIKESDWMLALLSKHSVRDPGVCLDEISIALGEKGGAIATVLIESESDVSPPVSVGHIQWLDMHDWAQREAADPAAFAAWYGSKLDEILALLASPATQRFAGEIEELRRCLRPLDQEADIPRLIGGFVGRAWLLRALEAWRLGDSRSKLFWLTGPPGTGKSAFAAWVAHWGKANVIGLNLCRYNLNDRRDAGRVIRTLAYQIATRMPDYRRLLLDHLRTHDPDGTELDRTANPADLFDRLLTQRLARGIDGGRRQDRYVLVIDALDESMRDGSSPLAEVLARQANDLPEWLALVVTGRPEPALRQLFDGYGPHWIDVASAENQADLRVYATGWLNTPGRSAAEVEALLRRVLGAAQGNFIYLRMLRDGVEQGLFRLDGKEGLPQGLVGLYAAWFDRQFLNRSADKAADRDRYEREVVPLLEVLAAATHPVPDAALAAIFGWTVREQAARMEQLGSLFDRRTDGWAPFHKSLRDWLTDPYAAGAAFVVDPARGVDRLARHLWAEFAAWDPDRANLPGAFCVAQLPDVLTGMPPAKTAQAIQAQPVRDAAPAMADLAATRLAKAYRWDGAILWWGLCAALAPVSGADSRRWEWLGVMQAADAHRTVGRTAAAFAACRTGLEISARLTAADPGNAEWQIDLSVSHERIGDVLVAQGDRVGALAAYRARMEISARLAAAEPGNAEWQRDLSVSHDRIGDVLVAQGDRVGALAAYRAAMEIRARLAAADPGNAEWQRDLSISHDRIGDVLVAQGDRVGALAAYRAGMEIRARLAAAEPGNAEGQLDLSISHDRIGDVLVAQGDRVGALAAYRAGMDIRARLAVADPGNAQWQRDLSVSHNKIGDVLVAQGDRVGALAAYRADMEISARLAAADSGNAEWQRDLSVSHNKIGDVLVAQGDRVGALAAYRADMEISARLAAADPGNAEWQRDLSVSHNKIGDVLVAQGDRVGALAAYRAGMEIRARLAAADPGNAQWQRDVFVSLCKLTTSTLENADLDGAKGYANRLHQQALLLRDRFSQDSKRDRYVHIAAALLAQAKASP